MKKGLLLTLALALGLGLASCGGSAKTYEGNDVDTHGSNEYKTTVLVTVKGDKITKIEFKEGSSHITSSEIWGEDFPGMPRPEGIDTKLNEYLGKYVGMEVSKVASSTVDGVAGATQTSGRIHDAIVDACSKVGK